MGGGIAMRWSEACELKRFGYPLSSRHPRLVGLYAAAGWMVGATGVDRTVLSADYLYRAGLALSWCGRHRMALRLLGSAARRYRGEGCVVELARLRVNEMIVRFRQAEGTEVQRALNEEIVIGLSRLDELECADPPFACMPAAGFLTAWVSSRSFMLGGAEDHPAAAPPPRPSADRVPAVPSLPDRRMTAAPESSERAA